MADLNLLLFISLAVPLAMFLVIFKGLTRNVIIFLLLGLVMCLLAGEINGLIVNFSKESTYYLTVNIIPIIEEILKAIPIIAYTYLYKPNKKELLMCAMVIGIGFAILENAYIFASSFNDVSFIFALVRGFGAGMMHALCTMMIGYGLSYALKEPKIALPGTFSLLAVAIMYHSTYNCIIQSDVYYLGLLLPIATFIPLVFIFKNKKTLE